MLYWAYGSNLCVRHMKRRCPRAVKLRPLVVKQAALVFRGVADVTLRDGSQVQGGLWRISGECERLLDQYEGVKSNLYIKRYLPVTQDGKKQDCLFYQMATHRGIMPPSEAYIDTIAQGYKDFGLDLADLDAALQEAWGTKKVTTMLRERHERKGRPKLARA